MGAGVESQFVHAFEAVGITVGVVDGKRLGTWVGSFVGRRLGARVGVDEGVEGFAAEGVWDGCVDGVTVGSAEGPNDGCSVVHHTASEGSALGVSVGRTEGFSVGIELGSSDGVMLALAEGAKACTPVRQVSRSCQRNHYDTSNMRAFVGCSVGVRDGNEVGPFVGVLVGDHVGLCRRLNHSVSRCNTKLKDLPAMHP